MNEDGSFLRTFDWKFAALFCNSFDKFRANRSERTQKAHLIPGR